MDEAEASLPYVGQALVFLAAASILPTICRRLRISPIAGFLVFGLLVGPGVLGRLAEGQPWLRALVFFDAEQVRPFAEIGVSLLLFMIGLELSFRRLWTMRRLVFGLGALQLVLTAAVICFVTMAAGMSTGGGLIVGASLALSSTAMVMQLLTETRRTTTPVGRRAFAILLFQDLAVAPLLLMVSLLAMRETGRSLWISLGELALGGVVIVAAIIILGRFVARPLLQVVGASKAPDAFMACSLFIAVGASFATTAAGLSTALGAFLAGTLLGETEYRHQIEVDLEPFKGLLLGLFFASIGMSIDPIAVWPQFGWIVLMLVGLMTVKAAIIAVLAWRFGLSPGRAIETGVLLSQAGEFALVALTLAAGQEVISAENAQTALIVAALSIIVTPFVAAAAGPLATRLDGRTARRAGSDHVEGRMSEHVIIVGFGRVGRQASAMLELEGVPFLAVDRDARRVTALRRAGVPAMFGDGTRAELLRRAGADDARAILVTADDPHATEATVRAIRREWPELPLHCRARDRETATLLLSIGATYATPETLESSLQLGAGLLESFGAQPDVVRRRVDAARAQFMTDLEPS